MAPRAPAASAKQIRWGWFAATRTSGAAGLPRIVWIDGCSCLISQAECWVSSSTKSYPASARIDTSTFGVAVVPTTVLPDLMESLRAFIWRRYSQSSFRARSTDLTGAGASAPLLHIGEAAQPASCPDQDRLDDGPVSAIQHY